MTHWALEAFHSLRPSRAWLASLNPVWRLQEPVCIFENLSESSNSPFEASDRLFETFESLKSFWEPIWRLLMFLI